MTQEVWFDARTATREQMALAFAQERARLVAECRQLQIDTDYFNKNHAGDNPIVFDFDFMKEVGDR